MLPELQSHVGAPTLARASDRRHSYTRSATQTRPRRKGSATPVVFRESDSRRSESPERRYRRWSRDIGETGDRLYRRVPPVPGILSLLDAVARSRPSDGRRVSGLDLHIG